ncbi:B12 binding domain-containing protein [Thermoflexibacter ruber]|uniref:B12 binding domain-containing protein n=1 Tax=Thermoflexibacter ruber TaxID=1003 RepID=A0A1I2IGM3_9BACT|nr:B12 binding domain-containing protein [Thermoflexibacter ruber]
MIKSKTFTKVGYYSIKDLENLTGIKAHTIRMWEQRYDIIKPSRTDTNIRLYEADQLKLMLNIALLNNHGFKISKIANMSRDEVYEKVRETISKATNYEDQINALTVAMIDLDEDSFEKIIATNILQYGFEKVMIHIIYPFLIRIGALWTTDAINPAQEHFITNLIRQKLIVAIDGQFEPNRTNPKKFILYLPEGELHEISLLFNYYLIKSRGNKVIYLGQSLPLRDLYEVNQVHKADFIMSIITSTPGAEDIQTYVDLLGQKFPHTTILLSGYQVVGQDLKVAKNVHIINQIQDMIAILDDLKAGVNPFE